MIVADSSLVTGSYDGVVHTAHPLPVHMTSAILNPVNPAGMIARSVAPVAAAHPAFPIDIKSVNGSFGAGSGTESVLLTKRSTG